MLTTTPQLKVSLLIEDQQKVFCWWNPQTQNYEIPFCTIQKGHSMIETLTTQPPIPIKKITRYRGFREYQHHEEKFQ